MNQQIDNALGGYEECASNPAKPAPDIKDYKFEANKYPSINWDVAAGEREGDIVKKPAPDTLLEQIKKLRRTSKLRWIQFEMADLCLSQAARIEELKSALNGMMALYGMDRDASNAFHEAFWIAAEQALEQKS